MSKIKLLSIVAIVSVAIFPSRFSTTAYAQGTVMTPPPMMPPMMANRTITVLSSGSASATAERVSLGLTVSSADQTATGLFVRQNDVVKHLKDALMKDGIKAEDITEQPFRLMPNMEYGQAGTRIIGYRLDTPLEVEIDNVKDLPHVIDLATQNGASAINVGSFSASEGRSLHAEAVKNAIAAARKEADAIAKEMGVKVGNIVSISETGEEGQQAATRGGGEEEERREMKMKREEPNSLAEKAQLKVVFEVQ